MWHASPLKKVRSCRRYAHDPDAETVPLRFAPNEDGGISVGVGGLKTSLKTCASWHSCLICGAKIAVHRTGSWNTSSASGGSSAAVVLATFSCRHHLGQSLRNLFSASASAGLR